MGPYRTAAEVPEEFEELCSLLKMKKWERFNTFFIWGGFKITTQAGNNGQRYTLYYDDEVLEYNGHKTGDKLKSDGRIGFLLEDLYTSIVKNRNNLRRQMALSEAKKL